NAINNLEANQRSMSSYLKGIPKLESKTLGISMANAINNLEANQRSMSSYLRSALKAEPKVSVASAIDDFTLVQANNIIEQTILELKDIVRVEVSNAIKDIDIIVEKEKYVGNSEQLREINRIESNDNLTVGQKLHLILESFSKRYPIFALIIMSLVLSPIQSSIDDWVKNSVSVCIEQFKHEDKNINIDKKVKQQIVKNAKEDNVVNKKYIFNTYRFVSTDVLFVRSNKSIRSYKIGELKYGDVVTILKKNKNWTLVEYSQDDCYIKGWVFTRYISRFDK
ncbi:SH3 domain-containing protein, partial [Clostridium perfringens]|uniref:SH3 domain-containing protein n=1 Tax=Clostridium perfringens TaxID=1502 RepID=UPI0039E78296